MDYSLILEQGLKQQLSQYQIMSLNMLALDNGELEEFLEKEYEENPMLEYVPVRRNTAFADDSRKKEEAREYMFELVQEKGKDIRLYFMEQLKFTEFSMRQWRIISYMISCVSETGLLEMQMEDIAAELGAGVEECEECRQDSFTMGKQAGKFLMQLFHGKNSCCTQMVMDANIVERESVRNIQ